MLVGKTRYLSYFTNLPRDLPTGTPTTATSNFKQYDSCICNENVGITSQQTLMPFGTRHGACLVKNDNSTDETHGFINCSFFCVSLTTVAYGWETH